MREKRGGTAPGSESGDSGRPGAPSTELARGLSLGRYIVVERLGAGGMGVVYAAYDPELDRKVAIKVLRADRELGAIGDRSSKLMDEAKRLASVDHRNVVKVHHVDSFLGQVFIAMEFLDGGTLSDWLRSSPPWAEVLHCFIQAGEGLAAAHAKGLVHRDFKPDNVLLDSKREPHVIDFGLAKKGDVAVVVPAVPKTGRVAGTIGFLAPEQARRQDVDARSDQFSFCLSLYLGLYAEPAFPKEIDLSLPLPAVPAAPKDSAVPGWVRRVVLKGLSENPADRYPSMAELLAALSDDPARARREVLIRAVALLLVATVVGLAVLFLQRETPEERAERECLQRVEAQQASMWSPARRTEIEQGFGRISKEVGPDKWKAVAARLDPELADWHQTSRAACVLKGDPAVRARWVSCLEEHRKTLQSMSDLFATADADVMAYAVSTVLVEVTPASACKSSAPAQTTTVESSSVSDEGMRSGLARARVLRAAGKLPDAIGEARDVATEARNQSAHHVEAEAMLLVGEVSGELHRIDAEQNLREAIVAAERVGNDEIRARAWIALVAWYAEREGRLEDAELADDQARAILQRLGFPPLLHASQLMAIGKTRLTQDDPDAAFASFEGALKIRQSLLQKGHPSLERSRAAYGSSMPVAPDAVRMLSEVLQTQESIFGPKHPETANAHHNLGIALIRQKDCAGALGHFETALAIRLKDASANRLLLGRAYQGNGRALACLERLAEAESNQRRAAALLKDSGTTKREQRDQLGALLRVMRGLNRPAQDVAPFEEQLAALAP